MANCPIPKLLTYNKLVSEVQKIDIGKVYSVKEDFFPDNDDYDENVSGCYRHLREYLPALQLSTLLRKMPERCPKVVSGD